MAVQLDPRLPLLLNTQQRYYVTSDCVVKTYPLPFYNNLNMYFRWKQLSTVKVFLCRKRGGPNCSVVISKHL